MNLILIRHGESEGNYNQDVYLEKLDENVDLTEKGFEQARNIELLKYLYVNPHETLILSSPFLRAYNTAKTFLFEGKYNKILSKNRIIQNPLLVERAWGNLREKVHGKIHTDDDFRFFNRPENGESFFDLYQRVLLFKLQLQQEYIKNYQNIIIFSHGEWIKMFDVIYHEKDVTEFVNYFRADKIQNCEVRNYSF